MANDASASQVLVTACCIFDRAQQWMTAHETNATRDEYEYVNTAIEQHAWFCTQIIKLIVCLKSSFFATYLNIPDKQPTVEYWHSSYKQVLLIIAFHYFQTFALAVMEMLGNASLGNERDLSTAHVFDIKQWWADITLNFCFWVNGFIWINIKWTLFDLRWSLQLIPNLVWEVSNLPHLQATVQTYNWSYICHI